MVHGEIDNRERGRVTGRIWFAGREEPVELELKGNAWRDLAGRRLEFVNPKPVVGDVSFLRAQQVGVVGDCTASRKVRVPELSREEFAAYYKARKPFPWHWANSLYLEWFSAANGRIVIESADYQLTVTDGPTWEMSEAEETDQLRANATALTDFMRQLGAAFAAGDPADVEITDLSPTDLEIAAADDGGDASRSRDEAETADEPQSAAEAEAERAYDDNERLLDRIEARMAREGDDADFETILEEELNRMRAERGEPPLETDEPAELEFGGEEPVFPESGPADADAIELGRTHPVYEQAREFVCWLEDQLTPADAAPTAYSREHPINELRRCAMMGAAKLAGALNSDPLSLPAEFRAGSVVRLKRARAYYADARAAADDCPTDLVPARDEIVRRLAGFIADCDRLIAELRNGLDTASEG